MLSHETIFDKAYTSQPLWVHTKGHGSKSCMLSIITDLNVRLLVFVAQDGLPVTTTQKTDHDKATSMEDAAAAAAQIRSSWVQS